MKRRIAYVVGTCVLIYLIVVIFLGVFDPFDSRKQMAAAKKYMDSLTDKDIHAWIQRAKTELEIDNATDFTSRDAPPDLQKLGITGIEKQSGEVDYIWLGGMDDTALDFVQTSHGDFQVFAVYTPYSNRMIWPKQ